MKTTLRILLTLMLFATVSLTTFAYDFYTGDIYYNITDSSKKTVEVTYKDNNYNSYFGSIVIPSTVTYSGINYSVTDIKGFAFYNCSRLTSVTIPNSVTFIGMSAFYSCSGLKDIYCDIENPLEIDERTFYNCYSATLHVPEGCVNKYKSASYWNNFLTIVDDSLSSGGNEPSDDDELSGIYLGVIGFNNDLYERSIGILTASNVNECTNFVNSFSLGMNTLLYYSADHALKQIVKPTYPTDLTNAIMITFTDGLDRGSLAMQSTFSKNADYADYIGKTIGTTKVNGQELQAYSLGVLGDDVSDTETFNNNLKSLASKPENATLIDDIDNLNQKFNEIYDELERRSVLRALKISTAIMEDGEVCRFTLDGIKDAKDVEKSSLWVEGTYDFASESLKDVKYYGFTSTSGTTIIGTQDPSLRQNLIFTFEDCRDVNGDPIDIKDLNNINQWRYIKSSGVWERNSEMMSGENIEIEVKRTSAVVMLVLDCSLSLGEEDLAKLKFQANAFIERLAGVEGDYNGVENIRIDSPDSVADVDWSGAEYYNLQGVRVDNPSTGLYIQRSGRHSRKIMLR